MLIRPGRPFWSAFTAFCANMVALATADLTVLLEIRNWWVAVIVSLFVAGAMYGKEKVSEYIDRNGKGTEA